VSADELAYGTTTELAARIAARELSPVEAVDAAIARIEARNPSLNAFVYLAFDDARAAAREAERAVAAGGQLGPLHGVPAAIKDLFDFKPGWPATFGGVRALRDFTVDGYCVFAERVERAGAILLGKTNSPVMGMRGTCDNPLFGPSCNPFDTTRNTGGSSGGSAAAVADGLVPFAEGTDGGGSIRIPASWCGVYGFKASWGRVPYVIRPDAFAATMPFIFEGPITRTVDDAALVMSAIAGYDSRDPFALGDEVDFLGATRRSIAGARIAYSPDFDVFPVDPRVAVVVDDAVGALVEAGATVERVTLGIRRTHMELSDLWCRLIITLSVPAFERFKAAGLDLLGDHRDDFPPEYLRWIEEGYRYDLLALARDQEIRTEVHDAIAATLDRYDFLVTPTLACLPVRNADDGNTKGPTEIAGQPVDPLIGWCLTYPVNYSGHPACSIPAGFADGLPVGLQIVGRRYADADVLAASAAFERVRPWHASYERLRDRPLAVRH
jgi:amidase